MHRAAKMAANFHVPVIRPSAAILISMAAQTNTARFTGLEPNRVHDQPLLRNCRVPPKSAIWRIHLVRRAGRSEVVRPFATFLALRTDGCSRAINEMDSLSGTKWVGVSTIGRRILINRFDDPNERGSGFEA
jgi:hypothetical protein